MPFAFVVLLATTTSTPTLPYDEVWSNAATTKTSTVETTPEILVPPPAPIPESPPMGPGDREPVEAEGFEPGAPRLEPRPPPSPPPPKKARTLPPEEHVWYGWQNLSLGVLGMAGTIVGAAAGSVPLGYAGVVLYGLGPATVHWAHGNLEMGFASIGLQLGTPITGMFTLGLATSVFSPESDDAPTGLLVAGLIIGAATSIAVDSFVFAYLTEEPLIIRPRVGVAGDTAYVGLGGQF